MSDLIFRSPLMTPESRGGSAPHPRTEPFAAGVVDRDVAVEVAPGERIRVDVYRPESGEPAGVIIGWTPYGKHNPAPVHVRFPNCGVKPEHISDITTFEAPDPVFWVPNGYAVVLADIPGTWYSEGRATFMDPEEAQREAALIEWAGTQPWSNGKVGLSGVSYLTVSQWRVAELSPPHLAAINPWEGWTDTYREVFTHGGIPESYFWPYIKYRWGASVTEIEDLQAEGEAHPFYDAFWERKSATPERITVPAYVVASWSDHGLHSRGTLEAFRRLSSEEKWLDVHRRKKWGYYYEPEQVARQKAFFDFYLLGKGDGPRDWPKVRMDASIDNYVPRHRTAAQWPPAETEYLRLHLHAGAGRLGPRPSDTEETVAYDSLGNGLGPHRARFDLTFDESIDLVGHFVASLCMSAPQADDLDVFVGLFKLRADGSLVEFPYQAQFDNGPVALGWQRASHRELDEERSTPYRPYLKHERALPVPRGEVVRLEIEVWPAGVHFEPGETLVMVVQGTDVVREPKPLLYSRHEDTINNGPHLIHTGGRHESYLMVPVLPGQE